MRVVRSSDASKRLSNLACLARNDDSLLDVRRLSCHTIAKVTMGMKLTLVPAPLREYSKHKKGCSAGTVPTKDGLTSTQRRNVSREPLGLLLKAIRTQFGPILIEGENSFTKS